MQFTIHTDGGARGNPGPAAAAAYISGDFSGSPVSLTKYLGVATNNIAEYQAVILAFEWLDSHITDHESSVNFFLDSLLVVSQLKGEYKIKNQNLLPLWTKIKDFQKRFSKVSYQYIPRSENQIADNLVNKSLDENKSG